ncbi:hypothetical protein GUH04_16080 [Xanthomonas citri pv. citri]|uniref:amino acid synthesis family protein n=1 Tax=Xanthomonas citri TaxID=346 RepID=UPI001E1A5B25|nr:amino acid synthesis family protein [Xanthomonas citri]MBD1495506.1 hypothetical protein [Xanthomonas citri pv. citri]
MLKIRKILLSIERIHHEGGPARAIPVTMGSVAALVRNPYAGRYVEDLSEMQDSTADRMLTERLRSALDFVDIRVLDHVIVGKGTPYSFAQAGLL